MWSLTQSESKPAASSIAAIRAGERRIGELAAVRQLGAEAQGWRHQAASAPPSTGT